MLIDPKPCPCGCGKYILEPICHCQCSSVSKDTAFSLKARLDWINDLQSQLYINCVYCGHRYGPNEVEVPQDALRRHVATCPEHPLAKLVEKCEKAADWLRKGTDPKGIADYLERAIDEATK